MEENIINSQLIDDILDSRVDPTVILNEHYVILAANQAYEKLHDFKVDGQQHCYEISHHNTLPCDSIGEICPLKECIKSNTSQRTLHIHHSNQGEVHVDVQLTPIRNKLGETKYFVETTKPIHCVSLYPKESGLVGRSDIFGSVLELIQRVSCSDVSVLVQGESGTGKELIAEAIHLTSLRADGPFIALDCSGLTETLFESELFGHEKGAFTGALSRKIGLAETAAGGTLFLDEIGDIPINLQTKLLRLIESGTFRRVGGVDTIKADFRLVSASHRNIGLMVNNGEFRQDLYYRINTFPLLIPALRQRLEDIPLLVESFLKRYYPDLTITISNEAIECLKKYSFPGNIRELSNIVQRAALMSDDDIIERRHLPQECLLGEESSIHKTCFSELMSLKEMEEQYIHWASQKIKNKTELANKLGVSERTLYRKTQTS